MRGEMSCVKLLVAVGENNERHVSMDDAIACIFIHGFPLYSFTNAVGFIQLFLEIVS